MSTKILAELTDKNLFDLTIKTFSDNELQDIYKLKADDNSSSIKKRIAFYMFNYLFNDKLSEKMKNIIVEDYSHDFLDFLINKSKHTKSSTVLPQLSKSFINDGYPKSKLIYSYLELKAEFNQLLTNSTDKTLTANKLNELDKKIVATFANIQQYLAFALNIDSLRDNISFNVLKIKLEAAEKSKDKKTNLNNIYAELKANKQKKIVSLQNLITKINEQIQNQHGKITLNTNKLKMSDLTKSIQMFLKYNEEINSLYDKYLSTNKANEDLFNQITNRINLLDEHVKAIRIKSPQGLKDDLKYLLYLHELQAYHKIKIYQLNKDIQKNIDDLLAITNYISDEARKFSSMNIFSFEELNYINMKDYIENTPKPEFNIHIKPTYSACIYNSEDISLYGIINIKVNKSDNLFNLLISEKSNPSQSYSYTFKDIDSLIKFVINGFKKFDSLNLIK